MGTKVVTIIGSAIDYDGPDKSEYKHLLKVKHPYLSDFIEEGDTALITLDVDYLYLIDNFERVQSFEL